jgi:iron complex outermembrane receptor protein
LLLGVPVGSALAQDSDGFVLEEIVVTARKREESIQKTPVAITALSGEELQAKGAIDLADLNDTAPNLVFTSGSGVAGTASTANVFIRGVGQSDFVVTVDPGVGIYIDGVYYARTVGATLELLDLAQVEVLRGPQGTLFGRNTIGGAINVTTKQPSFDQFEGRVTVTGGQREHFGIQAGLNIPLADNVAARVSVMRRVRDGYAKALQYDDVMLGNDNVSAVRGQLRWDPSDRVAFNFSADYTKLDDHGGAWVADYFDTYEVPFDEHIFAYLSNESRTGNPFDGDLSPCTPEGQRTNPVCVGPVQLPSDPYATNNTFRDAQGNLIRPFSRVENYGTALTATFDFDVAQLKSITAYRKLDSSFVRALNHTPYLVFQNTTDVFDSKQFSQELQLTGRADRLNWLLGAYYFTEDGREVDTVINTINLVLVGLPFGARPNDEFIVENKSFALFGQATYDIGDTWHLTGGLRWTDEKKDGYTDADLPDGRRGHFTIDPIKDSELTPHVSLSHEFTDTILGYASYSKGFKSGTFSTRTPDPTLYVNLDGSYGQLPTAVAEKVDAYEVGMKADLLNRRLRWNAAVFRTEYDNMQINGIQAPGSPNIVSFNAGAAQIQGFETELTALVSRHLTLRSNIGLLDAKYTKINPSVRLMKDAMLNRAPDYQIGVGADLIVPLQSGHIRASLDWFFVDDIALDSDTHIKEGNDPDIWRMRSIQPAYNYGDLTLAYVPASKNWELALYVKNLSDKLYRTAIVDSSQPKNDPFGNTEVIYARPREAYATFTWRF